MQCSLVPTQLRQTAARFVASAKLCELSIASPAVENEHPTIVPPPAIPGVTGPVVPIWFSAQYGAAESIPYPPRAERPYSVTVVVPTRNEADNLLPVLVAARPYADELLVIDGHSTDGTRQIAIACGAHVLLDEGKGKGGAIRQAIQAARGDVLVFVDADGSHDPAHIPALLQPIFNNEADHVSGSRMLGGSDELHATIQQFVRLFGSQVITLLINYTLNVRLTDCQNGFRAIRKDVAEKLGLAEDITTIEQEMIIKTLRRGYRMAEVATHEYGRANGQSNFRVLDVWPRYLGSLLYYLYIWKPRPTIIPPHAP